jgi:hypothetical protein
VGIASLAGPRRPSIVIQPTGNEPPSYTRGMRALVDDGVPFLVGGALALAAYCGIRRFTRDLDLFLLEQDVTRALETLARAGFRTETPFPHWLAKAYDSDARVFIDIIFSSGNGAAPVDADWFAYAPDALVLDVVVPLCPAEETLWSKAFVMERERFDGADVAHLLLACAPTLDWERLLRRFDEHWRVLLAHLVLFGYVFPDEAQSVPRWVMDELLARLRREGAHPPSGEQTRVCRGPLLSREQYLPDLARGWRDARLQPTGRMSEDAVAIWTEAIPRR